MISYSYVSWKARARPKQLEPNDNDWALWLVMAGRGWGKTLTGAETTNLRAKNGKARTIALVAPNAADARDVMVDETMQNSGILATAAPDFRPKYLPSKRRIEWPNGAIAFIYSAEDPEQLRGPQHDWFWADELGAWAKATREATWSNLMFGMRKGRAQGMVTTTPKPIPWFKRMIEAPSTRVTIGSTYENINNLSPRFFEQNIKPYEGTRLGRQELNAELLYDNPDALFTYSNFDRNRIQLDDLPLLSVKAVAVDPSGDEKGHEVGIIAGGTAIISDQFNMPAKHGYVLADWSLHAMPNDWALKVIQLYDLYDCDYVIVEKNFGGAMVKATIDNVCTIIGHSPIKIHEVNASVGKTIRAEPVSAIYDQNRIHHVGNDHLDIMETQLVDLEQGSTNDRADANVWLFTDLMVTTKSKRVNSWS